MANLLGKRYRCETCKTEALCLAAGQGEFTCCGAPMVEVKAEALPSAD